MNDYIRAMNRVRPSAELVEETARAAEEIAQKRTRRGPGRALRPLIAMAAVIALLAGMTPVLAANNETVNDALYQVSPVLAQKLRPVKLSSESNGIRMEVVSAHVQGDTAAVYVAMTDLEEDRIDGTTDLFDSYEIRTPRDSVGHCERLSYDGETGTCTFLITVQTMNGGELVPGGKVTFSVREFLSGGEKQENQPVDLDLSSLPVYADESGPEGTFQYVVTDKYVTVPLEETPDSTVSIVKSVQEDDGTVITMDFMKDFDILGGSYIDQEPVEAQILFPGEELCPLAENLTLTGAAVINGRLHVQMRLDKHRELDPHGCFYLKLADGTVLESRSSVAFRYHGLSGADSGVNLSGQGADYQEFVFDTQDMDLADCALFGDYYTNALNTKGNWYVTFPLDG